ncbi:uncharacterized protein [Venturia canescens]|uniref:uncharacterized protein isoform X3 n=1 Tax=Venturia canescens TaxID=32260 RepID=UPI001C9D4358|nr:uncharacterized protein LOC122417118 isoform X3 [Venturia canescens]
MNKMRDTTIITHADVYNDQEPSTSKNNSVMRSGDSPPPLQASIPSAYDVPDDAGLNGRVTISSSPAITTSIKPLRSESGDSDAEVISIEEAVPIVHKTLPSPEPQPKIEKKNGYDSMYMDEKKLVDPDDDPCIVKCVYFAQQLCECTIM